MKDDLDDALSDLSPKQKDEAMRRLSGCFTDRLRRFRHYRGRSNDCHGKDEACKRMLLHKSVYISLILLCDYSAKFTEIFE